ncbi:hypothetical protein [Streptomyces longisporoflavus]|uniref:hypothetical protein n=1 Tax=Streptomyces longisporoflavus TaxID=28044 RepID=UPI00167DB13A|nr:hypothetical protein [Streptomyces longisporoflavus]
MRKWRSAAVTAAWVAMGTAAGALGAWQLATSDSGNAAHSRPLDEGAVERALAATSASASPSASPSPSSARPEPATERSTLRFTGGTATVECRKDGTVYLVSWSPSDGFHIDDDVERGPGRVARLEAEPSDDDDDGRDDLPYEIRCGEGGRPGARVVADD